MVVGNLIELAAVAGATAVCTYLASRRGSRSVPELERLKGQLDHMTQMRSMERAGRIRAEQALRVAHVPGAAPATAGVATGAMAAGSRAHDGEAQGQPPAEASTSGRAAAFPFQPIGYLRSCFNQRNGTPRQPLLVPGARAVLQLEPDLPISCLEGLDQYSHCWVLYVFHANTDIHKAVGGGGSSGGAGRRVLKGKIHVPRLEGGRMGVLATRTPHRPSPIGLSVAQVVAVEGGRLTLGGADIVDGSPILDVKPYVPFCDAVPGAQAPEWVQAEAHEEPLHVSEVVMGDAAAASIAAAWRRRAGRRPLFPSDAAFLDLVRQALSRDIRSVHQRRKGPVAAAAGAGEQPGGSGGAEGSAAQGAGAAGLPRDGQASPGFYHVILDRVDVAYDVDADGRVVVHGGAPAQLQAPANDGAPEGSA